MFASEEAFWPCNYTELPSSWYEHVPFAYWVTRALAPDCLVELGTHFGLSYLSFCEAIDRLGLPTTAYAVDTWQGDEHAGFYGQEVYDKLAQLHDPHFSRFSRLVRATFDEAVGQFADGSIDLLHIDGLHTYEAVKHDFETWRPKLASSAVVLFHDSNVRERNFGVWKLWQELAASHPHFEFLHGHGLGVLGIGTGFPPALTALFAAGETPRMGQQIRNLFARLGGVVSQQAKMGHAVTHLVAEVGTRDARIASLEEEVGTRDARIVGLEDVVGARDARIVGLEGEVGARDARITNLEAAIDTRDRRIATLMSQSDGQEGISGLAVQIAEQCSRLSAEIGDHDRLIEELRATHAQATAHLVRIGTFKKSLSWRATRPLRGGLRKPRKRLKRAWRRLVTDRRHRRGEPEPGEHPAASLVLAQPETASPAAAPEPSAQPRLARHRPCVVFISGEPDTPGHYYRVENIRAALAERYYETVVLRNDELPARADECVRADVLWIWRTSWTEPVARAVGVARANGARVVFDVDDLMFRPDIAKIEIIDGIRSQDLTEDLVARGYSLVRQTLANADHATAPTETLAQELRRTGTPATVIPNGYGPGAFALSRTLRLGRQPAAEDGWLRIGYASGSRTHQRDFAVAAQAVADILSMHPNVRLVLFAHSIDIAEFPELVPLSDRIEWRSLVPVHELPKEYARFDINIAPLEVGNVFCEAKSELKFFEPALCGVVTVASPTQPFREAIRHGETGFLAADRDAWRDCLETLVTDAELRDRMAASAFDDAVCRYGPERRTVLVNRLVTQLLAPAPVVGEIARASVLEPRPVAREVDVPEYSVVYASPRRGASRVAVVVPLYNYSQYVCEALESVAAQTMRDIDVIVVDDNSTDDSLNIAKSWIVTNTHQFNYVALLKNEVNSGLSRTRNSGIDHAGAELILPLDADNQLLPTCVQRCVALLDETNAAMAYPTIEMFGDQTGLVTVSDWDVSRLQFGNYIDAMAMFRMACWLTVGGYTRSEYGWEDFDLWCKFAEAGFWGVRVPEVTARYRVHGQSMLKTVTDVLANRERVTAEVTARHPWLDIAPPGGHHGLPATTNRGSGAGDGPVPYGGGLDQPRDWSLLSLLQCPETGEALERDGDELRGVRTGRRWPIVDGRPVFTKDGRDVHCHAVDHVSNPLPRSALHLIEGSEGPVLNLSGGASSCCFDHVVEAEYSLFRTTDVAADAHHLPFKDSAFDLVVCLNAFEHYREPTAVAAEIRRVLRPGGKVFIHTAFMQPLHEAPYHYFNCTKYGLEEWLRIFDIDYIHVSANLNPAYAFSWLASDLDAAMAAHVSEQAAADFRNTPVATFVDLWRDERTRRLPVWEAFFQLPQEVQERFAAGWEAAAHRPS
ncbi:MAG: glycosyltransferase [Rhodospirillales bacterium]